ncbi:hypothetical protein [Massilia sp. AB1]|uniref:hypothetical protein n=1 Tax=Massilia sp. AB1 TaxID=2823371 RepID=UPI001B8196CA|nr:hypothetical protein [Massilia sp. AB1]MBQ5941767.1 hypothetical protein [Massilia sp. AB1]
MPAIAFEAYHGTSDTGAKGILQAGYNNSQKPHEWLGHGVYFFVDGISDPIENAHEWARAQAWDAENGKNKYHEFAVLKSTVTIDEDRFIDITTTDGLKIFNDAKELLFNKIEKNFRGRFVKQDQHNCILFNFMVNYFEAQAVKHHLYIKSIRERKLSLRLNVPNTTVLCVRSKDYCSNTIVVGKGEIK